MALAPGTRLGVYEVVALVGEGGMGQVYRARDTTLHRDVALKVLPDAFAGDAERLARFTREARTLASLNHPTIAHVHGFEESGGVRALVMEFVEGEDLTQRIARGAIPVDEALPIARQIADALEAAHAQGIIHRDLKPANIKLRPDGSVKVLDFGLAKALAPPQSDAVDRNVSQSPTITSPAQLSSVGMLLGTAAYMAPEQAKGQEADKRSDLWAFGCVLYEMLTGQRAFDGEDTTEVLGAVVRLDPAWASLPHDVPPSVRSLLRQCLVKDRRQRIADIAVARFVLDHEASVATPISVPARSSRLAWALAAVMSVIAITSTFVAWRTSRPDTVAPDVIHFAIAPPENTLFGGPLQGGTGTAAQLAISPDGRTLAFVAGAQATYQLWLRPLASGNAQPIAGSEGASFPFWSPDSRFVAFFAGGKLKRVAIAGGPPIEIADAPAGRGGTWNRDNVIVFDRVLGGGLFRVPSSGDATPTAVTTLADGEDAHRWPHFLPDGQHFLFTAVTGACCPPPRPGVVKFGSIAPGEPVVTLLQADSSATYGAGQLFFARGETLMAQGFDPDRRQLVGDAAPVIDPVGTEGSRYVSASLSRQGTLVFSPNSGLTAFQLTWFDRAGVRGATMGDAAIDSSPVLSPNERQVALALRTGSPPNLDIWTIDVGRNLRNRVTSDVAPERSPVWSPDGTSLVLGGSRLGEPEIPVIRVETTAAGLFRVAANGMTPKELLVEASGTSVRPCGPLQCGLTPTDWSSDGRFVLYTFTGSFPATSDIWALPMTGDRKPIPIVQTAFSESAGVLSPDGRWIAYVTDEPGQPNVYVQPFLRTGGKYRISPNGGRNPHWRDDGKALFYLDASGAMTTVPIDAGEGVEVGSPTTLFRPGVVSVNQMYSVTRDGRFLINARPINATTPTPLTVIVNWTSSLQK